MTNQTISSIPNSIILEPNGEIPPQDQGLSQFFHSYSYKEEVDCEKEDVVDLYNPLYDKECYDYITHEWSNQTDEYSFDTLDDFLNQGLEIHDAYSNPLFQLEEINHVNIDTRINVCTFSYKDDDEFKGIPMFLNPLYESSLH